MKFPVPNFKFVLFGMDKYELVVPAKSMLPLLVEVALADPPALVTVITTRKYLLKYVLVISNVEFVAPEIFEYVPATESEDCH